MNNYEQIEHALYDWANERGLDTYTDKQAMKLQEEVGELIAAIIRKDDDKIVDSIGDIQVVLIILSHMLGHNAQGCLQKAYKVIENRKGKNVNGAFVKETDL